MWTDTGLARADIEKVGKKIWRRDGKQLLLLISGGRLFAIANRCPHEGYPLFEGTDGPGCTLVCNWHGWRFDLETGEALIGSDPVRTYAVEERDGSLFVDLADPPPEELREHALAGLDHGIADVDGERIAREVARLDRAGYAPEDALRHAIEISSARFEFGMGHAYAAAPDWLKLSAQAGDPGRRFAALIEPIYHIAWDIEGEGEYPADKSLAPWDAESFVSAIGREDEAAAQRLVSGALHEGMSYAELRPVLAAAALQSYADFGHSAIYVFKAGELIDELGEDVLAPVIRALVRSLAMASREEKLPEFRNYAKAVTDWGHGGQAARAEDFIHQSVNGALRAAVACSARPPREIYDGLLEAAGWNQLRFNTRWERAVDGTFADNVGWLDFTHALTFANAARHLCEETPALWPQALLQLALFVGRNKRYVDPEMDVSHWRVEDAGAFMSDALAGLYDHGQPEPIVSAHLVKISFALEDEMKAAPQAPWVPIWLAAVNRFLHTPLKRRHALRAATQALEFVAAEA